MTGVDRMKFSRQGLCIEIECDSVRFCSGLCSSHYHKNYYARNKSKLKAKSLTYARDNPEKIKQTRRNYYQANRDKSSARNRIWRETNRSRHYDNGKRWRSRNPDRVIILKRRWNSINRDKIRRAYYLRYRSDENFRIKRIFSSRLRIALRKQGIIHRDFSCCELFGCSIERLRNHLESNFTDGMSWENYGFRGWHVDHIIACSKFDLTKTDHIKKCFNWKNLQPLWWRDNLIKQDK